MYSYTFTMAKKLEINGEMYFNTTAVAKRLRVTPKRVLEFIAQDRLEAMYLHGYYISEADLKKFRRRRPGRPAGSAKKPAKKS